MKKIIPISLLLALLFSADLWAQRYGTTGGVRSGRREMGISLQQRLLPRTTAEALVMIGLKQYSVHGLLQYHYPIIDKGLNYYIGAGIHTGSQRNEGRFYGMDVMLGFEVKLPAIPLLLSADFKPMAHIGHSKSSQWETGISVRYIFVTHRDLKKRKKRKEKEQKKEARKEKWDGFLEPLRKNEE